MKKSNFALALFFAIMTQNAFAAGIIETTLRHPQVAQVIAQKAKVDMHLWSVKDLNVEDTHLNSKTTTARTYRIELSFAGSTEVFGNPGERIGSTIDVCTVTFVHSKFDRIRCVDDSSVF